MPAPEQPAAPPPPSSVGYSFQKSNYLPSIIVWSLVQLFYMILELRSSRWLSLGLTALSWIFLIPGIQLHLRKPKFLTNGHIVFFAKWVVDVGVGCLLVWVDTSVLYRVLFYRALSLAVFFLVRLYFMRSVRVRTYMGTDAYITQCPFTRKVRPPQPAVPDQ
jgi:hypothetical protein